MSAQQEATYQRVAELERAGVTRAVAFAQVADREGITKGAVSQRYYAARPNGEAAAKPRARAAKNGRGPDASLADALDEAATIVRDAAIVIRSIEEDAARWRELRAMLDG